MLLLCDVRDMFLVNRRKFCFSCRCVHVVLKFWHHKNKRVQYKKCHRCAFLGFRNIILHWLLEHACLFNREMEKRHIPLSLYWPHEISGMNLQLTEDFLPSTTLSTSTNFLPSTTYSTSTMKLYAATLVATLAFSSFSVSAAPTCDECIAAMGG